MEIKLPKEFIEKAVQNVFDNVVLETGITLQECVEKNIPKKPDSEVFCPCCGVKHEGCCKYCPECGQAIDWT